MDKKYLYFKGKKRKTKNSTDNRGKLSNYRILKNQSMIDMNLVDFKWIVLLVLIINQLFLLLRRINKFYYCWKIKRTNCRRIVKTIRSIFKNRLFKKCIKGIITDQGKEFSKWKEIEKITNANVYFAIWNSNSKTKSWKNESWY
ncbi:Integrase core domain [Spiroplasma poulsonii]|nr:Integrase core domain [Spiroplasma poulsonii]